MLFRFIHYTLQANGKLDFTEMNFENGLVNESYLLPEASNVFRKVGEGAGSTTGVACLPLRHLQESLGGEEGGTAAFLSTQTYPKCMSSRAQRGDLYLSC